MRNNHLALKFSLCVIAILVTGAAVFSSDSAAASTDDPIVIPLALEEPAAFVSYVDTSSGRPILYVENNPQISWYNIWIGSTDLSTTLFYNWVQKDASNCDAASCAIYPDAHPVNGNYAMWMQTWGANANGGNITDWVQVDDDFMVNLTAPGLASGITTVVSGTTVVGSFPFVPHATWYEIWLGKTDFSATLHYQWHSALDLGCNGSGTCSLTLNGVPLQAGSSYLWYVRSWGPGGLSQGGSEDGWAKSNAFLGAPVE